MRTDLPTLPRLTAVVVAFAIALVAALAIASGPVFAADTGRSPLLLEQKLPGGLVDLPVRDLGTGLRADTTWYGDYEVIGGVYYARRGTSKPDIMWTFDRGNGPSGNLPPGVIEDGEGWSVRDMTANDALYFRVIDNTLDLGQGVTPPIISGARTLWVGADKPQADAFCWPCGPGYGNNWCQRVVSEELTYSGAGSVTLEFRYFNDSEPCFDGTQIYLRRADNTEYLLNPVGACPANPLFEEWGGFTDRIGTFDAPATYTRVISQGEIGGAQAIRIVIEFVGDGGYSDQDCEYDTIFGPFGADDVTLTGGGIDAFYDFETGLQGWTPAFCNPIGSFVGIEDIDCYTILDPCACRLEHNVMEFHAGPCESPTHPVGQHVQAYSPICDDSYNTNLKEIFMEFDMYAEMPRECGVLLRPGWLYFPWTCEITGAQGWSPRVGQDAYNYYGADPVCATWRYGGTTLSSGTPVPPTAQKFVAIIELLGDCGAFTIDPCTCPGGNGTPLIDNIAVGVTAGIQAPIITFEVGAQFNDCGSYPQQLFDPRGVVPANIVFDKNLGTPDKPARAGDSLVVAGPLPGNDPNKRWEARMWWRVAKRGAFQSDKANGADTKYKIWKDRVADGKLIDRPVKPQFTFGWMDSAQAGALPARNKFLSSFREDDDDFRGEGNDETEMIWDDVLVPGTRIEYFITSSYVSTPNLLYYYPDTAGGFFREFEALPGIRTANVANCGGAGFNFCAYQPATLYIDMYNAGSQFYIENALRSLLNGLPLCAQEEGCAIPQDRNWDRYDYLDAASSWNVPFGRPPIAGSNAGMTPQQILGYRAILANSGTYSGGATEEEDWALFTQWLFSPDCNANTNRQAFLFNGDKTGEILQTLAEQGVPFLTDVLQATLYCDAFNGFTQDPDCAPENTSYCVQILPVAGGPFGTLVDVDAYGSFCPNLYGYNAFNALAGGAGNRTYSAENPPKTMQYEQVVSTNLDDGANYKTVLDGVSWHHMTKRNPNPPGGDEMEYCPRDVGSVVEGSYSEIRAALRWAFDVNNDANIPKLTSVKDLATCQGTFNLPADVDDASLVRVNRLFQNEPNPFNTRSTITFSLARTGPVEIMIYDVNGRQVKTLVNGTVEAGTHQAVWDGTNDSGHKAGSGVYWSQMKAGSFTSNKKMVILR